MILLEKIEKKFLVVLIFLLLLFIVLLTLKNEAFDDLVFDYTGYALRMNTFLEPWINNYGMGIPTTIAQTLTLIFPLIFKSLGFGLVTLPLVLGLLLFRLITPFAFVALKKIVDIDWRLLVLGGIFFVFNPVSVNFLHRYLEFTGWFFFIFAFSFFYEFISVKNPNKKSLFFSVLFSLFTILSHTIPTIFLFFSFLALSISREDFKRAFLVIVASLCLSAFWLFPTIAFQEYSLLSLTTKGLIAINTPGIFLSSMVLTFILFAICIFSYVLKIHKSNLRLFQFFYCVFALSLVKIFLSGLPVISMIFAHSYHVFFIFSALLFLFLLVKKKLVKERYVWILILLFLLSSFLIFPARYGVEPRFSDQYDLNKFELIFSKIPKNERVELLPADGAFLSYYSYLYGFSVVDQYIYVPLRSTDKQVTLLVSNFDNFSRDCKEFNELAEKTAINYWIANSDEAKSYLTNCGMKNLNNELPILFKSHSEINLVENGSLVSMENTKIVINALPPSTLLKINYFPRWFAYAQEKELPIENANPGMRIKVEKPTTVELHYSSSAVDWFSIFVSLFSAAIFLFFVNRRS